MWWLKLIGSIFVVLGCVSMGMERTYHMKQRIRILREMNHSLRLFKSMVQTYRLPLEWVCERICEQVDSPVSEFYAALKNEFHQKEFPAGEEIWKKCIMHMGKAFDKEDQMLFLRLGDFLGIQDIHIQNEAIEACILQITERCAQLERERPEKEKIYRVLSLTISGFLILLFI